MEEASAINYVMVSTRAMDWIQEIHIDEDGLYQPKGKNETDHNEDGYQTLRRQMARKKGCVLPEGCPREMGTVQSKHGRGQDGILSGNDYWRNHQCKIRQVGEDHREMCYGVHWEDKVQYREQRKIPGEN